MSEPKASTTSGKELAKNVALLIATVLIVLVILELILAFFTMPMNLMILTGQKTSPSGAIGDWADTSPYNAYDPTPGVYLFPGGNNKPVMKSVNSHGFMSTPELNLKKPPNTIRIVFLGGSSTAGTGPYLPDNETWPWKVSTYLKKMNKNIEFINAAVGGYSSFDSYGRLWSRIRFFQPDVIVVYHGWNEMYYFDEVDTITKWRTLEDGGWSIEKMPVMVYNPLPIDPYIAWSQLLTRVRLLFSTKNEGEVGKSNGPTELANDFDHRGVDVWKQNLHLIKDAAGMMGAELFVCLQATLLTPDLSQPYRDWMIKHHKYHLHGFDHGAHVRAFNAIYDAVRAEIDPTHVIDATSLSGNIDYFFDHIHLNPNGTTALANIVADQLTENSHVLNN